MGMVAQTELSGYGPEGPVSRRAGHERLNRTRARYERLGAVLLCLSAGACGELTHLVLRIESNEGKNIECPWTDHPITIEANVSRVGPWRSRRQTLQRLRALC